jgi:hypothetical protein
MELTRFVVVCARHGALLEHERAPVSGWDTRIIDVDTSWSVCPLMQSEGEDDDCSDDWQVVTL